MAEESAGSPATCRERKAGPSGHLASEARRGQERRQRSAIHCFSPPCLLHEPHPRDLSTVADAGRAPIAGRIRQNGDQRVPQSRLAARSARDCAGQRDFFRLRTALSGHGCGLAAAVQPFCIRNPFRRAWLSLAGDAGRRRTSNGVGAAICPKNWDSTSNCRFPSKLR